MIPPTFLQDDDGGDLAGEGHGCGMTVPGDPTGGNATEEKILSD